MDLEMDCQSKHRFEKGLSLTEVMLGIVVGITIISTALFYYSSLKETSKVERTIAQIDMISAAAVKWLGVEDNWAGMRLCDLVRRNFLPASDFANYQAPPPPGVGFVTPPAGTFICLDTLTPFESVISVSVPGSDPNTYHIRFTVNEQSCQQILEHYYSLPEFDTSASDCESGGSSRIDIKIEK